MKIQANNVLIIGGGLAGTLMAILLARQGVANIRVLERQDAPSNKGAGNGRSFNLTLSKRGEIALEKAGILEEVLAKTVPVTGRMCHVSEEEEKFFPYGVPSKHILYSINRGEMNTALNSAAKRFDNIQTDYNVIVTHVCKATGEVTAEDRITREPIVIEKPDFIIGADGAFSTVRRDILTNERQDYSQNFLQWGYREVIIPAGANGRPLLDSQSLHVWPRGDAMMFALPNVDGSFTGNFIFPLNRENELLSDGFITNFFKEEIADIAPLVPDIEEALKARPVSNFLTIRTQKWHHDDKIVLLGDSAHGIVPFYGQGMNSSFDDCLFLLESLQTHGRDYKAAFQFYQQERKQNTDLIADLSLANFEELRNGFRSPVSQARRRIDWFLFSRFPEFWRPLHILISHTGMSYKEAVDLCKRRDRVARLFGFDLLVLAVLVGSKCKDAGEKCVESLRAHLPGSSKQKPTSV